MRGRRAGCDMFRCRGWSARSPGGRRHASRSMPSMLTLAGLQRVRYVFVYPESGDVVLAGPAGDWKVDADGRIRVGTRLDEPVVRLDDLLVLLRRGQRRPTVTLGARSIRGRRRSRRRKRFWRRRARSRLQPGQRKKWLGDLRDTVGQQDIEIFGVDPASRVASVLVEADYHMKLIGMGLADGVDGVESYLASIRVPAGESPPPMSVLRWWFALNYDAIRQLAGARCVRARRPGRARAERKRAAGRAGPASSHGSERAAQSAVRGELSPIISPSWRRSIRSTASCGISSIWRWPWR